VIAQLIFHCGMENIVWFAQQVLNMIQIKDNVIIALKDLLEIPIVIVAFQDFELNDRFIGRKIIYFTNKNSKKFFKHSILIIV
jgi:hypothetical protein